MAEYIEREAALRVAHIMRPEDKRLKAEMANIPAADVAPVVHGRWIRPHWKNSNYCYDCSECGGEAMHRDYQWAKDGIYPICPNCGARMDGESNGKAD
nr:MAG TPA: zinc-ribbon domain protein [Caudoviricetes sp.]